MKTKLKNQAGFSLLEVLIALVILSIGVLATTKMQLAFMQGNAKANIITTGTAQAQEKIEELLSISFDDTALDDTTGDGAAGINNVDGAADHTEIKQEDIGRTYTFFWNVANNTPSTGIKEINVIVRWDDEKNVQREVNYTFYRTEL